MSTSELLAAKLEAIVDIARFAPSVHNTQPWVVTISDISIVVSIDPAHRLHDGDPTGRETIISLGIFAEAICLAAATCGLRADSVELKDELCVISFGQAHSGDTAAVELLKQRCTDRSVYKPLTIPSAVLDTISQSRQHAGISITTATDTAMIAAVAQLTGQGIQLALSNPDFREELSQYLVTPGSHQQRGIATRSLYIPRLLQYIEPWLLKTGLTNQPEVRLEKQRWESASGLVFICSDGDLHEDWFQVGRSYLAVSLAIEKAGLSQATSAAIVEASDFHEDIEKLLGTTQRIQAILRVGQGKTHRYYSPRVSARELLATSN
jgi:hypothetical protein